MILHSQEQETTLPRTLVFALSGLVVLGLLMIAWLLATRPGPAGSAASGQVIQTTGTAQIGGPFELVDQNGRTVTDATFRGKKLLVYFGFTHCPDVCPTGLSAMSSALQSLGEEAADVQPLFITVDPARDTPDALQSYMTYFGPSFLGLTGSDAQVDKAAKAYRVYYKKAPAKGDAANYSMDHSSIIYLMDENGRYVQHFTHEASPEAIAGALAKMR